MVHAKTFKDPLTGRFLKPEEVDLSSKEFKLPDTCIHIFC